MTQEQLVELGHILAGVNSLVLKVDREDPVWASLVVSRTYLSSAYFKAEKTQASPP